MTKNRENRVTDDGGTSWRDQTGVAEDTARVVIYPPERAKSAWEEEAGDTSLSKYIQEKVAEARLNENNNQPTNTVKEKQVKELQERIEHLEKQLERKEQQLQNQNRVMSDHDVIEALSDSPKEIEEISREVVENTDLDLGKQVEQILYRLAQQKQAEFVRANNAGWRLTQENGNGGN